MKFKIDKKIFEKFPSLNIGVIIARGIDNNGENLEILDLLKEESFRIKSEYDLDLLSQDSKINSWREAYKLFGAKPKNYRCSVENLYRMILGGTELKHINKVVDLYNYISLKYIVLAGGDDIDKVDGDITLKFAEGDEQFIQLNSDKIDNPKEGEVVYADDKEILCRRWNWRECDKSKMTKKTKNIILVIEGLSPITKKDIEVIINELGELIKRFCGGEIHKYILNSENKEINL